MSYARMSGDSDVYIFEHADGFIQCCGCSITEPEDYEWVGYANLNTAREALAHLDEHVALGYKVPQRTFERIREAHGDLDAQIEKYVTPLHVRERQREAMRRAFDLELQPKNIFHATAEEYAQLEEALDAPPNPEVAEKLSKLFEDTRRDSEDNN
jgi:hypothetical protein